MMTIDEAIAHAKEVAKESRENIITGSNLEPYESDCNAKCEQCAEEHEQLAEWLEELKSYRASVFSGEMTQAMLREEYNKAIDDFEEKLLYQIGDLSVRDIITETAVELKEERKND